MIYDLVRLRGGPADGELVRVVSTQDKLKVSPEPELNWSVRTSTKFFVQPPVFLYIRDVNKVCEAHYSPEYDV